MNLVRNDSLRSLSQLFTPSEFRQIVRKCEFESHTNRIKRHIEGIEFLDFTSVIQFVYRELESSYRNEYVYKNALLNEMLLKRYGLAETVVLNEFRISGSIADFVLLNGEVRIFEIKTDLDGFEKLAKQIEDYQKFANKVFVVVGHKNSKKIFQEYKDTPVGVISYNESGSLETIKEATNFTEKFDYLTIFKTLRKDEYLKIIKKEFGSVPDVPNTIIFKECLNLVKNIEVERFQSLAYMKLKQRSLKCPNLLLSNETPKELKHICYSLNLSDIEYKNLYQYLKTKI